MKIVNLHSWDVSPKEAIWIQREIRGKIIPFGKVEPVRWVAGADVAYDKRRHTTYAGVVILRMSDLAVVETRIAECPTSFPYIPGLLSFREAPALVQALKKIQTEPDIIFIDGHGLSHPRSAGIASHIGLLTDRPVIGCAKSLLVGDYQDPPLTRGSQSNIYDEHPEIIGAVVRTRDEVKPVFVSIGHRIDLDEAVRLTLSCGRGYRIPEPTRQADLLVEKVKRESQ